MALAARGSSTKELGFNGNSDIYGLGIRVGYYTQALSVWAASHFIPREAHFLYAVNILFMIAMLGGIILLSIAPEDTYGVEIFMLIQITTCVAFMGTKSHWRFSVQQRMVRDGAFIALDAYQIWYWWVGLWRMRPTPGGTLVWYFNRGDLYGWVAVMMKIFVLPAVVYRASRLVFTVAYGLHRRRFRKATSSNYLADLEETLVRELEGQTVGGESERPNTPSLAGASRSTADDQVDDKSCTTRLSVTGPSSSITSESRFHTPLSSRPPSITGFPYIVRSTDGQRSSVSRKTHDFENTHQSPTVPRIFVANTSSSTPETGSSRPNPRPVFSRLYAADLHLLRLRNGRIYRLALGYPFNTLFTPLHPMHILPLLPLSKSIPSATQSIAPPVVDPLFSMQPIDPTLLTLLPYLHLTRNPPAPRTWKLNLLHFYLSINVITILLISAELTIQWNYIRGVQNLLSVGQLIPFVIGVGGLVKVAFGVLQEWAKERVTQPVTSSASWDATQEPRWSWSRIWGTDMRTIRRAMTGGSRREKVIVREHEIGIRSRGTSQWMECRCGGFAEEERVWRSRIRRVAEVYFEMQQQYGRNGDTI